MLFTWLIAWGITGCHHFFLMCSCSQGRGQSDMASRRRSRWRCSCLHFRHHTRHVSFFFVVSSQSPQMNTTAYDLSLSLSHAQTHTDGSFNSLLYWIREYQSKDCNNFQAVEKVQKSATPSSSTRWHLDGAWAGYVPVKLTDRFSQKYRRQTPVEKAKARKRFPIPNRQLFYISKDDCRFFP